MPISEYMTSSPHFVGPDHSMAAAHRLMQRHQIRHLPIIDEGTLKGVVTQRDLYFIESLGEIKTEEIKVAEAMELEVMTVAPTTPVSQVAKTMIDEKIGSVLVMDADKVCGIFTTIDALKALMELTNLGDEILDSAPN